MSTYLKCLIPLIAVALVAVTFAGCTNSTTAPSNPTPTPTPQIVYVTVLVTPTMTQTVPTTNAAMNQNTAGIANPASVYCNQVGGTDIIKKDATGAEYGICTFPDGSSCEEWALYRGQCKPTVSAPTPVVTSGSSSISSTTLSGSGDDVVSFTATGTGLRIFTMRYTGTSNFIVVLKDGNGGYMTLLANEIGSYSGKKSEQLTTGKYYLDVTASGPWSIQISS
jgi:putative hemolysin